MCRQDEAGFPQKQLETAFLHSLRLLEQNREYLQMHLQPLKDARTAQALEDMEQEAARLERTFRELMELSAPEGPVQKRPVDLCRLLAQLEGLRGEIDAQSSTKLTVDCGGLEQCLVWGDREMAEQICFHLLSNALRAAAPGGNIQVCLRQTGQDIRRPSRTMAAACRKGRAGSKTAAAFWAVRRRGCCSAAGIAASWAGSLPCCPAHRRASGQS